MTWFLQDNDATTSLTRFATKKKYFLRSKRASLLQDNTASVFLLLLVNVIIIILIFTSGLRRLVRRKPFRRRRRRVTDLLRRLGLPDFDKVGGPRCVESLVDAVVRVRRCDHVSVLFCTGITSHWRY